jgi:hypothetical protein
VKALFRQGAGGSFFVIFAVYIYIYNGFNFSPSIRIFALSAIPNNDSLADGTTLFFVGTLLDAMFVSVNGAIAKCIKG